MLYYNKNSILFFTFDVAVVSIMPTIPNSSITTYTAFYYLCSVQGKKSIKVQHIKFHCIDSTHVKYNGLYDAQQLSEMSCMSNSTPPWFHCLQKQPEIRQNMLVGLTKTH